MDYSQVRRLLKLCVTNRLPVLLAGAPGVGKTDIIHAVQAETGFGLIVSHPVVAEPTDAKGLPFPNKSGTSARFLPYGDLAEALSVTKPTIWFLDDLGQASPSVQASFMQLLLARRIGEHILPDHITFVAATNRKKDRAGVAGILEPVKSRFVTLVTLEPDVQGWMDWALSAGAPPEVTAFLRFRPGLLLQSAPSLDLVNSPAPRTWTNLCKLLNAGLDEDLEYEVAKGCIGEGAAVEFISFMQVWRELPSPEAVLLSPDTVAIPENPSTLFALSGALAHLATVENFSRIAQFAERLLAAGKGEFAGYLIQDAMKRYPKIKNSSGFVTMICGPLGELFN
jgi:hypothetical protein